MTYFLGPRLSGGPGPPILLITQLVSTSEWPTRLYLTKRYSQLAHEKMIVGYDDGCHYHAYVTNTARANALPEAAIIAKQAVIIDNCHLRGHTDPRCKLKFDPKKHPLAKEFNTQVAEQKNAWQLTQKVSTSEWPTFLAPVYQEARAPLFY